MAIPTSDRITNTIAMEIKARPEQVCATVALLEQGATVPFIARYRKEVTGGLDDSQLRLLTERLTYLRDRETRRAGIIQSIETQGKLTDELRLKLEVAESKAELEDLYLPYKPKRRSRAQIARENGLGPLAAAILADRHLLPEERALDFLNDKIVDVKAALDGARDIIAEEMAENAELLGQLRETMRIRALIHARVIEGKEAAGAKFADYFNHSEPITQVPSHRALAMLRGRSEEILMLDVKMESDQMGVSPGIALITQSYNIGSDLPGDAFLRTVAGWAWRVKLSPSLSLDLMRDMRERAEIQAIEVFARNLKNLLLAAPAGRRTTIGLDPGIRTGVKLAVIDGTGKLLETATLYPFAPRHDVGGALAILAAIIKRYQVQLIAIGNGTASRETEKLVAGLLSDMPPPKPLKVVVSEAGASVYSACALAAREFPDLDVSLRGAVSIARRLQDPLAELVKIEPKAIGVGQYQHDVDAGQLARALDGVVEDAVNAVGVDLNTASAALLTRISGLGQSLAEAIVAHRDSKGAFRTRKELMEVPRLGAKAFEQCAGFLRIVGGEEPLDASSVHPEAYPLARQIIKACGRDLHEVMRDPTLLKKLDLRPFITPQFGLPTLHDIISELEKPGRDPRPEFTTARFAEGIDDIKDLKPGMMLEGTVTNVAAFGAFVDIGVHQDGLVHISALSDHFVKDPHALVKVGDIVKVRVVEVDITRKRIALSMRSQADDMTASRPSKSPNPPHQAKTSMSSSQGVFGSVLADALQRRQQIS